METLSELFNTRFGTSPDVMEPMAGAGSNRKYYRLNGGGLSAVGVCGTSAEENRAFIYLSRHFRKHKLPMPEIFAVSADAMRYLQEDFGGHSLYDALAPARARSYEYDAADAALIERTLRGLAHVQVEGARDIDESSLLSPRRMDTRAAMFDLNYFKYMFLRAQDIPLDEILLEDDMLRLASDLCGSPCQTFLYRDFQARNVMLSPEGEPRFIDFQGGRLGPLQYDVASFLWQASAHYPETLKERLLAAYLDELATLTEVNREEFTQRLQGFVLLRTLQVLGAYGLRGIVERKTYFLQSIPPALDNLRKLLRQRVCRPYPYLEKTLHRLCDADTNYGKP